MVVAATSLGSLAEKPGIRSSYTITLENALVSGEDGDGYEDRVWSIDFDKE